MYPSRQLTRERAHSISTCRRSPVSKVPAKRSSTRTCAALDMWSIAEAAKDGYEYGAVAAPDGALIGLYVNRSALSDLS
jgi:hypothetical protein